MTIKKKKKIQGEMPEKKIFLPFRQICYFHVSKKKEKCHRKRWKKF